MGSAGFELEWLFALKLALITHQDFTLFQWQSYPARVRSLYFIHLFDVIMWIGPITCTGSTPSSTSSLSALRYSVITFVTWCFLLSNVALTGCALFHASATELEVWSYTLFEGLDVCVFLRSSLSLDYGSPSESLPLDLMRIGSTFLATSNSFYNPRVKGGLVSNIVLNPIKISSFAWFRLVRYCGFTHSNTCYRNALAVILASEKYVIFHFHHCSPLLFAYLRSMSLVECFWITGTDLAQWCGYPTS